MIVSHPIPTRAGAERELIRLIELVVLLLIRSLARSLGRVIYCESFRAPPSQNLADGAAAARDVQCIGYHVSTPQNE